MSSNKALVWRFFIEVLNDRSLAGVSEMFSPQFLDHSLDGGDQDLEAFLATVRAIWVAFPDLEVTILDQVADRDRVVIRCVARGTHLGPLADLPATACSVSVNVIDFFRVENDRIHEHWGLVDRLGLLHQLGAAP